VLVQTHISVSRLLAQKRHRHIATVRYEERRCGGRGVGSRLVGDGGIKRGRSFTILDLRGIDCAASEG
jgi:hypothetical protein